MKNICKRTLAVLLVVLMAFSAGATASAQENDKTKAETAATQSVSPIITPEKTALATELTLGTIATATLTAAEPIAVFKFTPDTSGWYVFSSGENGDVDPFGYLYNETLEIIGYDDDNGGDRNFRITYDLAAGERYYLAATTFDGRNPGNYQVTVRRAELKVVSELTLCIGDWLYPYDFLDMGNDFPGNVLSIAGGEALWEADDESGWYAQMKHAGTATLTVTAPDGSSGVCVLTVTSHPPLELPDTFTIYYHETLEYTLLKDVDWPIYTLEIDCDSEFFQDYYFRAIKRGTTTVTITAPDGSSASVRITVKYSFKQWLNAVFLGDASAAFIDALTSFVLNNPSVYKPLFPAVAIGAALAWLPVNILHWAAPDNETYAQAQTIVGLLTKLAWEPGFKKDNPYFLPGDAQFQWEPGAHWTLGFAKQNLTDSPEVRENIRNGVYAIPGYNDIDRTSWSADIMDDLFVKAVYLDDNTGYGGILYAVVDCFGIVNADANAIRAEVWGWAREKGVRSIHVAATHTHTAIDTVGTGNILGGGGQNPAFQRLLIEKTAQAMKEAYENRKDGNLYLASTDAGEMFRDSRWPQVFEPLITRFRFAPAQAGENDVYLLSAGVHPESAWGGSTVTADFPAYAADYIMEKTDAETLFIQGALGIHIVPSDSPERYFGEKFAQYALGERGSLSAETQLPALLNIVSAQYELPFENILFILSRKIGVTNHAAYNVFGKSYKYAVADEVSYLRLGDKTDSIDILIQSSELAPEIAMGGFFSKEQSPLNQEYPRRAIFEYLLEYPFASERQIVFGMANNFTGYIIPDNDFVNSQLPYINARHAERLSAGPQSAKALTEAFCSLFESVRG